MVFDIIHATTSSSIQQLKESYFQYWQDDYISELYNLWYYTDTYNDNIINGRMYYKRFLQSDPNDILYWNANFSYNTQTNLYLYDPTTGNEATSSDNGLTQNDLSLLTLYYTMANICFPADTPITTNQGIIPIQKINPDIHTINDNKILSITRTISTDKYLVCFEKHAIGLNCPRQKTIMSLGHGIYYKGKMIIAKDFLGYNKKIYTIKYNGEVLYNVLMDKHEKMNVNNLICETLHPKNRIAILYMQKLDYVSICN